MHDLPLLFFYHGFKFQEFICNGCHDLTMLSVNISNITIITITNVHSIRKSEAINLLENAVPEDHGYI